MNMRKTKAICPKCKSKNISITEISESYQTWNQEDGIINKSKGIMNHGDIIGIYGKCDKCGHGWKFKCLQIDNLIVEN